MVYLVAWLAGGDPWHWVLYAFGGIPLVVYPLILLMMVLLWVMSRLQLRVLKRHRALVQQDELARAYETTLCGSMRDQMSADQFKRSVERHTALYSAYKLRFPSFKRQNDIARLKGTVTGDGGKAVVEVLFVKEDVGWKIAGFSFG